ncbi:hypothetical protein CR513_03016, partial [Mucuna pruriens]
MRWVACDARLILTNFITELHILALTFLPLNDHPCAASFSWSDVAAELDSELALSYKLKSGLIHLLPKFHSLVGEDPHKHLKEFHVVFSPMRPQRIPEDYIKMKVFPFSLDEVANDWLYLQSIMFNTWGDMKCMFLEKFFLAYKTTTIWKEICGIRQHFGRYCMNIGIGLLMMGQNMVDAASGRAVMDKTPTIVRHLILNMLRSGRELPQLVTLQPKLISNREPTPKYRNSQRHPTAIPQLNSLDKEI